MVCSRTNDQQRHTPHKQKKHAQQLAHENLILRKEVGPGGPGWESDRGSLLVVVVRCSRLLFGASLRQVVRKPEVFRSSLQYSRIVTAYQVLRTCGSACDVIVHLSPKSICHRSEEKGMIDSLDSCLSSVRTTE